MLCITTLQYRSLQKPTLSTWICTRAKSANLLATWPFPRGRMHTTCLGAWRYYLYKWNGSRRFLLFRGIESFNSTFDSTVSACHPSSYGCGRETYMVGLRIHMNWALEWTTVNVTMAASISRLLIEGGWLEWYRMVVLGTVLWLLTFLKLQ